MTNGTLFTHTDRYYYGEVQIWERVQVWFSFSPCLGAVHKQRKLSCEPLYTGHIFITHQILADTRSVFEILSVIPRIRTIA